MSLIIKVVAAPASIVLLFTIAAATTTDHTKEDHYPASRGLAQSCGCSASSCTELGWDGTFGGSASTCAESEMGPGGVCSGTKNQQAASNFCTQYGARLCTLDEITTGETQWTGCDYDDDLIWSCIPCTTPPTGGGNCDICPRGHSDGGMNHLHPEELTFKYISGNGYPDSTTIDIVGKGDYQSWFDKIPWKENYNNGDLITFKAQGNGYNMGGLGSNPSPRFSTDMTWKVKDSNGNIKNLYIHTSCSQSLYVGIRHGPFEVVAGRQPQSPACEVPSPGGPGFMASVGSPDYWNWDDGPEDPALWTQCIAKDISDRVFVRCCADGHQDYQCFPDHVPVPQPTRHPVPSPTKHPAPSPTKHPVPSPTKHPVPSPTKHPVPSPTKHPVPSPTKHPMPSPTKHPAPSPTKAPVPSPTKLPVPSPTGHPVEFPVPAPTKAPVPSPTKAPVPSPTKHPVPSPTGHPVEFPVPAPTKAPVPSPTKAPVPSPTQMPITDPGGTCFHGNGSVLLESGATKPFSELSLGDVIKTSDGEGQFSFNPVLTLPHDRNTEPAAFLTLTTETGKKVDMTSDHFIPKCDTTLVTAGALVVGDCLLTTDGKETLVDISSTMKSGVYTAITKDKFIVVDGIVASAYSKNTDPDPEQNYDRYLKELEKERKRKLEYYGRKAAAFNSKGSKSVASIAKFLRGKQRRMPL